MRKTVVVLTSMLLLLCAMAMTASAAVKPEIIKEPQNLVWPEGSDAFYTVDAYGDNLNYKWFIVCGGVTYDTTQYEPGQPWTNFSVSGSNCDDEGNTFYFNGILPEANGAVLYCEVTGTGGAIRSQPAVISVGGLPNRLRSRWWRDFR